MTEALRVQSPLEYALKTFQKQSADIPETLRSAEAAAKEAEQLKSELEALLNGAGAAREYAGGTSVHQRSDET